MFGWRQPNELPRDISIVPALCLAHISRNVQYAMLDVQLNIQHYYTLNILVTARPASRPTGLTPIFQHL
jgi:hypothetical protein